MNDFCVTRHILKRMNQRGITKDMVDFAFVYGDIQGDKIFTNRKVTKEIICDIDMQIEYLRKMRRLALKVMDKGGITVVADNGKLITAYNTDSYLSY